MCPAPIKASQKKAFGASSGAAYLGHQPKPRIGLGLRGCRFAFATGLHDLRKRTPVAAFLLALNAKAILALPLGCNTNVRSPLDLPSVVPSHKAAWVRVACLSKTSRVNIERLWRAHCRASRSWHAKQQQTHVPRAPRWA